MLSFSLVNQCIFNDQDLSLIRNEMDDFYDEKINGFFWDFFLWLLNDENFM